MLVGGGHVDPLDLAAERHEAPALATKGAVAQIDDGAGARGGEARPGEGGLGVVDAAATKAKGLVEVPMIAVAQIAGGEGAAPVATVDAVLVRGVVPVVAREGALARVDEADERNGRVELGEVGYEIAHFRPARHVDVALAGACPGAGEPRAVGQPKVHVLEDDDLAPKTLAPQHPLDDALDGGDVGHALVPPLGADLDEHDVVGADERLDAAHLGKDSVDVLGRRAAARDVKRTPVAGRVVGHEVGRAGKLVEARPLR